MAAEAPVAHDLVEEIDRLRRGLLGAGYTAEALRDRLGAGPAAAGPADVPLLLRRVDAEPLARQAVAIACEMLELGFLVFSESPAP